MARTAAAGGARWKVAVGGYHRRRVSGRGNRRWSRGWLRRFKPLPVRVHFQQHAKNTGLANVWAAVQAGGPDGWDALAGAESAAVRLRPAARHRQCAPPKMWCTCCSGRAITTGLDVDRLIAAARWLGVTNGARDVPGIAEPSRCLPEENRWNRPPAQS